MTALSFANLRFHFSGPDPHEVENARKLCEDLVANVTAQYEAHKAQPTTRYQGYNHHHHNNNNNHHSGHNSHNYNNHHVCSCAPQG